MTMRTFVCKECGVSFRTDLPGRFTTCDPCKERKIRESRAKVCVYRHCGKPFSDESSQNSMKFCTPECARREKMFRSGKAGDESYFRIPGGTGKRNCTACEKVFVPSPGEEKTGRCEACRESLRNKECLICGTRFRDDSLKNTRRYCDGHSIVGAARNVYVAPSRSKSEGGDLKSLTPFTTTWWGRVGEVLVLHLHPEFFDAVKMYGNLTPYDLYDRERGKIAVKTAGAYYTSHGRKCWKFQFGSDSRRCDAAFMLGFSEDRQRLERAWFLPFSELPDRLKVMSPDSKEYIPDGELPQTDVAVMDRKFRVILRDLPSPLASPTKRVSDHTVVGRLGERVYASLHPRSDHVALREPTSRYDFLDEGGTKVNVRTRRPEEDGSWKFAVPHEGGSDVFYFLALNAEGSEAEAAYRVPVRDVESGIASVCLTDSWVAYAQGGFPVPVSSLVEMSESEQDQLFLSSREIASYPKSEVVSRALRYHREQGFPYPEIPSDVELGDALSAIRTYQTATDFPPTTAGLSALSGYFPHRFESRNENSDFSAVGAFWDDERFKRALAYTANGPSPSFTRGSVRGVLTALNRTPGQFSPGVAKELVRRFCPSGGIVFDPCAGWGGRLVGTLVAGARYYGLDVSARTANALGVLGTRVRDYLGLPPETVSVACGDIEKFEAPTEAFDFAVTSPPYWGREQYDVAEERTYEDWRKSFLGNLFEKVYRCLKPGSYFALNVSDYQDGGSTVPLVRDSKEGAYRSGFVFDTELRMEKHPSSSSRSYEPILVFKKV